MTCTTCGRQIGACRHTTEGQVTTERPSSRAMAALLGKDPTRPQSAVSSSSPPSSAAAAGGADFAPLHIYLALRTLREARTAIDGRQVSLAGALLNLAIEQLEKAQQS